MSPRIIPLEPVGGGEDVSSLTDVAMALYLEGLPRDIHEVSDDEPLYERESLVQAAEAIFGLGCAMGVAFPGHVPAILDQTHPDDVQAILDECREPLSEQVQDARRSGDDVGPWTFLSDLFESLEPGRPVAQDAAYNVLSISFEYGCILGLMERSAGQVVRNRQDRANAEALVSAEADPSALSQPGPFRASTLQVLATELLEAYEADFGVLKT